MRRLRRAQALNGQRWQSGCILLALMASLASSARAGYEVTDLGVLSSAGGTSQATAISLGGIVTGTSNTTAGGAHAFTEDTNTGIMSDLDKPSSLATSEGLAINATGSIVGVVTTNGVTTAFSSSAGGQIQPWKLLPGWIASEATAINDRGDVVGTATLSGGVTHAFLSKQGHVADLGPMGGLSSAASAINHLGQLAGSIETSAGVYQAFRTDTDGSPHLFATLGGPGTSSVATGMNDSGEVVGYGGTAGSLLAFRSLPDGSIQNLGTLPGAIEGYANSVNNYGQAVGTASYISGASEAFYFSDRTGLIGLNQLLANGYGWNLVTATGINDYGQIVGTGLFNGTTHAYLLTPSLSPVPEPSSLVLMGLGLLGLLAEGHRRRRRLRRGRTGAPAGGGPGGASPGC